MVGKAGFEPAISRSRTERDTRLRYFPMSCFLARSTGHSVPRSRTECLDGLSTSAHSPPYTCLTSSDAALLTAVDPARQDHHAVITSDRILRSSSSEENSPWLGSVHSTARWFQEPVHRHTKTMGERRRRVDAEWGRQMLNAPHGAETEARPLCQFALREPEHHPQFEDGIGDPSTDPMNSRESGPSFQTVLPGQPLWPSFTRADQVVPRSSGLTEHFEVQVQAFEGLSSPDADRGLGSGHP